MTWLRQICLCLFCLGWLTGCARFESKPLSPAHTAADLEGRSLSDEGLRHFIEKSVGRELAQWPLSTWDFSTLTLAALYFHPSLDVARAQWAAAKAAVKTAGGRPNPTLSLVPEYSVNPESGVSPWVATVSFNVPIETAGKRRRRITRAEHLSESARLTLAGQAWQVRSQLRGALLEHTAARQRATHLRTQFEIHQQIVTLLEQRLAAGAVAVTEIAPFRLALIRAQTDLAEAERRAAESRARLAEALGLPLKAIEGVEFKFDLPLPAEAARELESTEVQHRALLSRADLLAALAEYAAAESALALEVAKQYPDVHLGPGYQYDQGQNKWALGLTVELPLLNRNEGPITEAEAKRAEAAARFVALQAKVIAEIERALTNRAVVHEQLRQTEALVRAQRKLVEARQAALDAGGADQVELRGAQLEASLSALAYLDAQVRVQQAFAQLEDAVQVPFPAWSSVEHSPRAEVRKEAR